MLDELAEGLLRVLGRVLLELFVECFFEPICGGVGLPALWVLSLNKYPPASPSPAQESLLVRRPRRARSGWRWGTIPRDRPGLALSLRATERAAGATHSRLSRNRGKPPILAANASAPVATRAQPSGRSLGGIGRFDRMSNSDDELPESRDDPSLRARLLRGLGDLDEDSSGLVLIFLVFFAPGLALLGFGAAEGLTGSSWLGAGGALLGLCAGVALVRDFLRWRFSWSSALLELAFVALLLAPYL